MTQSYKVQYIDGDQEVYSWIARRGHAIVNYPNGDRFEGYFNANGKKHGKGKYVWAAKEGAKMYQGTYNEGKRSGYGKMNYSDGSYYHGCFENDVRNGSGSLHYPNGDVFSGTWENGSKSGPGTYVFAQNDSQLVGTWVENEITQGKWLFPNTGLYSGEFEKNQPKGKGVFFHPNGLEQQGNFERIGDPENEEDIVDESTPLTFVPSGATRNTIMKTENMIAPQKPASRSKKQRFAIKRNPKERRYIDPETKREAEKEDTEVDESKMQDLENKSQIEDTECKVEAEDPESNTEEKNEAGELEQDSMDNAEDEAKENKDTDNVLKEMLLLETLFGEMDGNNDGKLDLHEMVEYLDTHQDIYGDLLIKVPRLGAKGTADALKQIDENGDGRLCKEEFNTYFYLLKLFHLCDDDNSGNITHKELFEAVEECSDEFPNSFAQLTSDRAAISARISEGDIDSDRVLTFEEFVRVFIRF